MWMAACTLVLCFHKFASKANQAIELNSECTRWSRAFALQHAAAVYTWSESPNKAQTEILRRWPWQGSAFSLPKNAQNCWIAGSIVGTTATFQQDECFHAKRQGVRSHYLPNQKTTSSNSANMMRISDSHCELFAAHLIHLAPVWVWTNRVGVRREAIPKSIAKLFVSSLKQKKCFTYSVTVQHIAFLH